MSGRNGITRLYVGRLSSQTTVRDLEHTFQRYGRVCLVNLKTYGYAFVDLSNYQDADNAVRHLNGAVLNNRRMVVQFAVERVEARCTDCRIYGHLAGHCKGCYNCGERGQTARFCKNVPNDIRHERWSPSPSLGTSYNRRRRSYSRSRTPPQTDLTHEHDRRVSRNHNSQEAKPVLLEWQYPRSGRCFKCGLPGHKAQNCKDNECFRCGKMGHIKDCMQIYPRFRREQRYRSPPPSRRQRHSRRRGSYSRSRSSSPPRRNLRPERDRNVRRNTRQTRSSSPRVRNHSSSPGVRIESPVQELVDAGHQVDLNNNQNVVPIDRSESPVLGPYP